MLKRPISSLECIFLKDTSGNLFFLKTAKFRSDPRRFVKSRLVIRPQMIKETRSLSIQKFPKKARKRPISKLKERPNATKEDVVSEIIQKTGNSSIKHFTYTSWAKRQGERQFCFLDQRFAQAVIRTKVKSPTSTLGTLKGMINRFSDAVSTDLLPAQVVVKEAMKFLLKRLENKKNADIDQFGYKRKEELVSLSFADVDEDMLRILTLKKARNFVDSCSINLDKIRNMVKPDTKEQQNIDVSNFFRRKRGSKQSN